MSTTSTRAWTYYAFGSMLSTAVSRQLYTYGPGDKARADPGPGQGGAGDLRRPPHGEGRAARRRPLQPAGRPQGRGRRRQVRHRARVQPERPQLVRDFHFLSLRVPGKARAIRPIDGIQDAGRPHWPRLPPQAPRRRAVAAALALPITAPVPREYAAKFDRRSRRPTTTTSCSPGRT